MTLIALLIGAILIVAAIRNSQGDLFAALGQDVPPFVIWAAAIFAVGALGYIPTLKPASRMLLALVIVVLVVTNYQAILNGFQNAWQTSGNVGSGSGGVGNAQTPTPSTASNTTNTTASTGSAFENIMQETA